MERGTKLQGVFSFSNFQTDPLIKFLSPTVRAATGVLINIDQKQKLQNIEQNICNIDHTALYRPITDHKSSLKRAYFQKAVTLFDFVIVMENLYSNHNICRNVQKGLKIVQNLDTRLLCFLRQSVHILLFLGHNCTYIVIFLLKSESMTGSMMENLITK